MTGNSLVLEIQQYKRMGAAQSSLQVAPFLSQLSFIETASDRHFGAIDIYRTRQAPYEYVMDFRKTFVEDGERLAKYVRVVSQLRKMEHKNLAKIHHSELIEESQLCIKHKLVHTFANYYNFTLEAAIEKKKLQDSCFPENELIYAMTCLLDVAVFLQKYGFSLGEYRSQSVFLSPEGYIKLFLLDADEDNRHTCYYKVLGERSLTPNYIFAPEQLQGLNNFDFQTKYDLFKADVFAIGMLMLELVTLDKPRFYYNDDKTALKLDRVAFDVSTMATHYSEEFVALLKGCLSPLPEDRPTLGEAFEEVGRLRKRLRSATHCIRLQEDEARNRRSTKRESGMPTKSEHFLKGLQKKLTPSPITTMASSSNSNSTSGHLGLALRTQSTIKQ